MGAKVEIEGYKPGYYAVTDLNAGANGWGSPYEEDKSSNKQLCNGFMTAEADGCSDYDKEMFKRTILAHEAVFRQQVYELHRVYRTQRDLMKQYQNEEMHACPRVEESQRNTPSQVPLHAAKMVVTAAVNNGKSQPLKFLREGSVQSSPNGFPSGDAALQTKQGMLDLDLGADNCFEHDKTSNNKHIDFLGVSSDTKHQSDSAITLAGAEVLGRLGHNSSTSTSFLSTTGNLRGHHAADLNEPILDTNMGTPNGSVSGGPLYSMENSWQHPVWRSSITNNSFNKEYSKDKRTNEGTSSNFFDTSSRIKQEEKPFIDKGKHASNGTFAAPRYSDTDARRTFNVAEGKSANINQFMYQSSNSSTGWFSRNPLEASALNIFARHDHLHPSSINTFVAPVPSPHIGHPSVASRVSSCIVDPRSYNKSVDVQSFPSFNGSSTVNSYAYLGATNQSIGTWTCNLKNINSSDGSYSGVPLGSLSASRSLHQAAISSDLKQNNRLMFEQPVAQHNHKDPDFANGKGRNNFNLNEALSDGQEDVLVEQERVCAGSLQHIEGEGSVSWISWLTKKATFGDSTGLEEPMKVFEHSSAVEMKINKDRPRAAPAVSNLPDAASTSVGCRAKKDKTQESAACLPPSFQKVVPRDGQAAEGATNKSGAAILNLFDLNDDVPNEDNSESSIVSHECHVTSSHNNHAKKRMFVIDLEVPACEDAAATAAAEDILALSMDVPATDTPENMLQWFAELAISSNNYNVGEVEVQACVRDSSEDDDLDSFEMLTLKLEETKTVVGFSSRPVAHAVTNDEHTVSPMMTLLTKPRRGQQRKRRQKCDFQKDILPSISSLCRPEIIEDIQLLEGLVQTTGGSWESSLTRRRRTRGKKPKKKVEYTVEEENEISPSAKADEAGLEAEDRSMIGWGRTTRRCRRPRCPAGITISAAS